MSDPGEGCQTEISMDDEETGEPIHRPNKSIQTSTYMTAAHTLSHAYFPFTSPNYISQFHILCARLPLPEGGCVQPDEGDIGHEEGPEEGEVHADRAQHQADGHPQSEGQHGKDLPAMEE